MMTSYYIAYKCLDSVYRQGAYSGIELNRYLKNAVSKDKPFITALVYGVLDKDIELEYIIGLYAKVKPSVKPVVKIGVYCLKYSDMPDYAVVNECVKLCKDIGKSAMSGFVNAVLKRIAGDLPDIPLPTDGVKALSVRYSFPEWAVERLIKQWGVERTESFISHTPDNTYTQLRYNPSKITMEAFLENLKPFDYRLTAVDGCYLVKNSTRLPRNGYFVQSLGSVLVCEAATYGISGKVLDVCAAPGGKSVYMAQKGFSVTSCDIHEHRTRLIESYAEKADVNLNIRCLDAVNPPSELFGEYDLVLCDVPCSGMGVFYSKPDIKLNRDADSIDKLAVLQRSILQGAARCVKSGGRLVYSTCTVFDEENGDNVNKFLEENPDFQREIPYLPSGMEQAYEKGDVCLMPYRDGTEGFYFAVMRRS